MPVRYDIKKKFADDLFSVLNEASKCNNDDNRDDTNRWICWLGHNISVN